MVNIPEFLLYVTDNGRKVFDMVVVVGKEGHNTMMFTGNLNSVVFAPYWNIPVSIVEKEIKPAMDRDPGAALLGRRWRAWRAPSTAPVVS